MVKREVQVVENKSKAYEYVYCDCATYLTSLDYSIDIPVLLCSSNIIAFDAFIDASFNILSGVLCLNH